MNHLIHAQVSAAIYFDKFRNRRETSAIDSTPPTPPGSSKYEADAFNDVKTDVMFDNGNDVNDDGVDDDSDNDDEETTNGQVTAVSTPSNDKKPDRHQQQQQQPQQLPTPTQSSACLPTAVAVAAAPTPKTATSRASAKPNLPLKTQVTLKSPIEGSNLGPFHRPEEFIERIVNNLTSQGLI